MRYMKIQITAWRDSVLRRSSDTQRQLSAIADREDALKSGTVEVSETRNDHPDMEKARSNRTTVLALEAAVARAAIEDSFKHRRVGQFGYMEIDRDQVLALKDEAGRPFPESAAIEYEIVDVNPPMPSWGVLPVAVDPTLQSSNWQT